MLNEYGDTLNCHTCDDILKKERGHDEKGIVPFWVDGVQVFRCPLTFISRQTWDYIKAYGLYEKGNLPNGIAWNNESNKFIQAMMILENEFNRKNNEEIEKLNA